MALTTYARLESRIPEIIGNLSDEVNAALKESADAIAEGAKERVPVATGTLRDAIHVEEAEGGYTVVAGNTDAFYGHIIEHGSTRLPPRPFLVPAAEAEMDATVERLSQAMEDV